MSKPDAYAALRIPDFQFFMAMRLCTTLSIQIMAVSVGYFIYDVTNDQMMLGYVGLTEAVPSIAVSLLAGHLADKYNRRNLVMICLGLLLLCAGLLLALIVWRGQLSGGFLVGGIFVCIFLTGFARGFLRPAIFALVPQLVGNQALPNAITWESSVWQAASITGLAIGGLLYGFVGVEWAFGTMVVLMLIGVVCCAGITPHPVPPTDRSESASERIRAGLRFVFDRRVLVGAIALDLFAVLFGGAVALLPVFAKDILKVGPQGLGILRSAMALGAISTAFFIAHRPLGKGAGRLMLLCVMGFGGCIIGFGLSRYFWLSFLFLVLAGVFDEVSVYVRGALVHRVTPPEMKGRVASVNSIFVTSSNEIGAFESGAAATLLGTVPSVVFGGLMTLLIAGFTWWRLPELRNLDFDNLPAEASTD
jgi:MFS family permease